MRGESWPPMGMEFLSRSKKSPTQLASNLPCEIAYALALASDSERGFNEVCCAIVYGAIMAGKEFAPFSAVGMVRGGL